MGRGGREHLGTFAQQRQASKAFLYQLRSVYNKPRTLEVEPDVTCYKITEDMINRAEELWLTELTKPSWQRLSKNVILEKLLRGEIA